MFDLYRMIAEEIVFSGKLARDCTYNEMLSECSFRYFHKSGKSCLFIL
jgi:hypothetical protein